MVQEVPGLVDRPERSPKSTLGPAVLQSTSCPVQLLEPRGWPGAGVGGKKDRTRHGCGVCFVGEVRRNVRLRDESFRFLRCWC